MAMGIVQTDGLVEALKLAPLAERASSLDDSSRRFRAWWPSSDEGSESEPQADMREPVTDRRDWRNQIHVGQRWVATGDIEVDPKPEAVETELGGTA
jgi:CRISPR system Cascade subunit CasD